MTTRNTAWMDGIACATCGTGMVRSELRVSRQVSHAGTPVLPLPSLPVWSCPGCGRREPRVEP